MNAVTRIGQEQSSLPHSLDAEQAVLGAILFNNDAFEDVAPFLGPHHFSEALHGRIFEICAGIIRAGRKATAVSVGLALADNDGLAKVGGQNYLNLMAAQSLGGVGHIEYGRLVLSLAQRRELVGIGQEIAAMALRGHDSGDDTRLLEDAEAMMHAVKADAGQAGSGLEDIDQISARAVEAAAAAHKSPDRASITTGIKALDSLIGGLFPGDLIFVAGATSMGKTSLLQAVALNSARSGRFISAFSLEMTSEEWATRYISQIARVPADMIETGRFNDDQFRKIALAEASLKGLTQSVDGTPKLKVSQIRARAARQKRMRGLDLIVVDHLRFIRPEEPRANAIEQIQQITSDLKALGKDLRVPVVCAAHLNREHQKRTDHRPIMADLYGSSAIEQDADVVLFVHREQYYLERSIPTEDPVAMGEWQASMDRVRGKAEIICAKRRRGAVGNRTVAFDPQFTLFRDLDEDPNQEVFRYE